MASKRVKRAERQHKRAVREMLYGERKPAPSGVDEAPYIGNPLPDKSSMEEALHVTCYECGRGGGRHSALCSRSA